jgi:xanthine dehydrogenase YagS FAD-binding subunit
VTGLINSKILKTKVVDEALSLVSKYWVEPKHIEYVNVRTINEAVSLLDKYEEAKIVAGGVDLVRLMRNEVIAPKVLVNIETIPDLAYITEDAEGLKIGALATINDIETSAIIKDRYSLLAEAAHLVAAPQIRNMVTIGGNLCQDVRCWYYTSSPVTGRSFFCYRKGGTYCYAVAGDNRYHAIFGANECHAAFSSDMAPALLALEAKVKIASPTAERIIPLEELYTPLGNILNPNEMITELRVPTPKPSTKQRYLKFRIRRAIDPAISSVAAAIAIGAGRVSSARIVLGAVAPSPYRSVEAEEILKGNVITESLAETAAKRAMSKATPLRMNAYKVAITQTLVKRAIIE